MAFETSILTTAKQIIIELKPLDGIDKTDVEALRGCTVAKMEVNGVIKLVVERPSRPLRADLNLSDDQGEGGAG